MRAGLVEDPTLWKWSGAGAHCGMVEPDSVLDMELWRETWTAADWRKYLARPELQEETTRIRQCTHAGRPLGSKEFVRELEQTMKRSLEAAKGGRPRRQSADGPQEELVFEK